MDHSQTIVRPWSISNLTSYISICYNAHCIGNWQLWLVATASGLAHLVIEWPVRIYCRQAGFLEFAAEFGDGVLLQVNPAFEKRAQICAQLRVDLARLGRRGSVGGIGDAEELPEML